MKSSVKKIIIMTGALLFILSGCGSPPEKKETHTSSQDKNFENLADLEKEKVNELLDRAGEKINKLVREYLSSTNSSSQSPNITSLDKITQKSVSESKETTFNASGEMASLEKEAKEALKKDPLYQALKILEGIKF